MAKEQPGKSSPNVPSEEKICNQLDEFLNKYINVDAEKKHGKLVDFCGKKDFSELFDFCKNRYFYEYGLKLINEGNNFKTSALVASDLLCAVYVLGAALILPESPIGFASGSKAGKEFSDIITPKLNGIANNLLKLKNKIKNENNLPDSIKMKIDTAYESLKTAESQIMEMYERERQKANDRNNSISALMCIFRNSEITKKFIESFLKELKNNNFHLTGSPSYWKIYNRKTKTIQKNIKKSLKRINREAINENPKFIKKNSA